MSVGLKMLPTLAQPDLDNFHKIELKKKLNAKLAANAVPKEKTPEELAKIAEIAAEKVKELETPEDDGKPKEKVKMGKLFFILCCLVKTHILGTTSFILIYLRVW